MDGGRKQKKNKKQGGSGGPLCCGAPARAELPLQKPPMSPSAAGERDEPTTPPLSSGAAALSEAQPPEGLPPTEGWLWKAGEHHTAWKRRWFNLDAETRTLRYFVDEKHATKHREKGHIDLAGVSEENIRSKLGAAEFDIVTSSRTYHLRAEGEAAAGRWQKTLKSLVRESRVEAGLDVDAASRRFREAQAAHRSAGVKSGRAPEVEAASRRFRQAHAEHRSIDEGESKGADGGDRKTRSGVCTDVPVVLVSRWSARDPKPSHVLGYDAPRAHSLGYLGDKGRVPSHRLRYLPK